MTLITSPNTNSNTITQNSGSRLSRAQAQINDLFGPDSPTVNRNMFHSNVNTDNHTDMNDDNSINNDQLNDNSGDHDNNVVDIFTPNNNDNNISNPKHFERVIPFYPLESGNDPNSKLVYAAGDWDSCNIISSSVLKIIHILQTGNKCITIPLRFFRFKRDKSSRTVIKCKSGNGENTFSPLNKFGRSRPDSVKLCKFKNIQIGQISQEFGMDFLIRMYLLDTKQVPRSSYFTNKELVCFIITLNLCLKKNNCFHFIKIWQITQK